MYDLYWAVASGWQGMCNHLLLSKIANPIILRDSWISLEIYSQKHIFGASCVKHRLNFYNINDFAMSKNNGGNPIWNATCINRYYSYASYARGFFQLKLLLLKATPSVLILVRHPNTHRWQLIRLDITLTIRIIRIIRIILITTIINAIILVPLVTPITHMVTLIAPITLVTRVITPAITHIARGSNLIF